MVELGHFQEGVSIKALGLVASPLVGVACGHLGPRAFEVGHPPTGLGHVGELARPWLRTGRASVCARQSAAHPVRVDTEGVPMKRIGEWVKDHGVISALILASGGVLGAWIVARDDDPPPATDGQATAAPQNESAGAPDPPGSRETTEASSTPQDFEDEGTTTTAAAPRETAEDQGILGDYKNDVELGGCESVSGSDQWCFFAGHATSYVAWRLNTINFADADEFFHNRYRTAVPHKWGNATDWDNAAITLGITVDQHPVVGAVAQWERGAGTTYGFVAYVEAVRYDSAGDASSVVLSYMNTDRQAVTTDPSTWTLEEDVFCV